MNLNDSTMSGYIGLALALICFFALSSTRVVNALASGGRALAGLRSRRLHGLVYVLCLLILYVLAAAPPAPGLARLGRDLGVMAAYLLVPALAQRIRGRDAPRLDFWDLLTILWIWFPIEFDLLPDVRVASLPIPQLLGIVNGLLIYLVVAPWTPREDVKDARLAPLPGTSQREHPTPGAGQGWLAYGPGALGYTYRLGWADIKIALACLAAFSAVGIPVGLLSGFLRFGVRPFDPDRWLMMLVAGYLFTAVPEELLFRGIIQNMVERRLPGRPTVTLVTAALIFGLAHLDNATRGFPTPNWMYALMATLAGLAYGYAWRRTGKITASALTHALVNFVWGVLLTAGS